MLVVTILSKIAETTSSFDICLFSDASSSTSTSSSRNDHAFHASPAQTFPIRCPCIPLSMPLLRLSTSATCLWRAALEISIPRKALESRDRTGVGVVPFSGLHQEKPHLHTYLSYIVPNDTTYRTYTLCQMIWVWWLLLNALCIYICTIGHRHPHGQHIGIGISPRHGMSAAKYKVVWHQQATIIHGNLQTFTWALHRHRHWP